MPEVIPGQVIRREGLIDDYESDDDRDSLGRRESGGSSYRTVQRYHVTPSRVEPIEDERTSDRFDGPSRPRSATELRPRSTIVEQYVEREPYSREYGREHSERTRTVVYERDREGHLDQPWERESSSNENAQLQLKLAAESVKHAQHHLRLAEQSNEAMRETMKTNSASTDFQIFILFPIAVAAALLQYSPNLIPLPAAPSVVILTAVFIIAIKLRHVIFRRLPGLGQYWEHAKAAVKAMKLKTSAGTTIGDNSNRDVRGTDVRIEKRERRNEPYDLERYQRETEYYDRPEPPQPIIIRQQPLEQKITLRGLPQPQLEEDRQVVGREPRGEDEYYCKKRVKESRGLRQSDDEDVETSPMVGPLTIAAYRERGDNCGGRIVRRLDSFGQSHYMNEDYSDGSCCKYRLLR